MSSNRGPLHLRFWSRVDRNGPVPPHRPELGRCWLWTGAKTRGYGVIGLGRRDQGETKAHRVAFFLANGRWPEPCALHHCDNPACVKAWPDHDGPSHIWEGTKKDNSVDMATKGRHGFRQHPERTPKGTSNGRAKLTEQSAKRILRGEFGDKSVQEIARLLRVSIYSVYKIRHGLTWKHLRGRT